MRSAQGDFFDKVYNDTYSNVLKYVVVRCRNYVDIQDIVQNIYMNFYIRYRKYGRFYFLDVNKYIFRIAHDELIKYYKNTGITAQNISIDKEENIILADERFLTEDIVCKQCQKEEIWNLIKRKDIVTFKIFTLYFLYDYKISQIAQELNISKSGVKNKLYRTINELKIKFDKEDF